MHSLGIIILCHQSLERVAQVAKFWTKANCPVVLHLDQRVPDEDILVLKGKLFGNSLIRFTRQHRCDWGSWGLVEATLASAKVMLRDFPQTDHVFLSSGACLPLRPVHDLKRFLARQPKVDFIESASTADVSWTVGGLDTERFTLRFPFSWKKQRRLFDLSVELQRFFGIKRHIPNSISPHMGSQWWCLSSATLKAILADPQRAQFDHYFKKVWIPDESYFQTLVRRHSKNIQSQSLTLSVFDHQGKPHIFYDDHLQLLRRSNCFVARKIWPGADRLYAHFLGENNRKNSSEPPNAEQVSRYFMRARERSTKGRPGLYMQSRFPKAGDVHDITANAYSVFQGFSEVFINFESWIERHSNARVHGHLFDPARAHFSNQGDVFKGGLSSSAKLRDRNVKAFLTNLIWNTQGEYQCFQYGPSDTPKLGELIALDSNARICVVSGAWAISLFRSQRPFSQLRQEAALLQQSEKRFLEQLKNKRAKAQVKLWTLEEFLLAPEEALRITLETTGATAPEPLRHLPRMHDLKGFNTFLRELQNQGMHPYAIGNISAFETKSRKKLAPKPYLKK